MIELNKIYNEDCLEGMKRIPDGSVDCVCCDLPYGTIKGLDIGGWKEETTIWDEQLDIDAMFEQYERVLRMNGVAILFSQEPYTSKLRTYKPKNMTFIYPLIYLKNQFANCLSAKKAPVSYFEDISVFVKDYDTECLHPLRGYFSEVLMFIGKTRTEINKELGDRTAEHCFYVEAKKAVKNEIGGAADHTFRNGSSQFSLCTEATYNKLIEKFDIDKMEGFKPYCELQEVNRAFNRAFNIPKGKNHFGNVLNFGKDKETLHPTQKPVALIQRLIEVYTNEGDTVLDNCMGSGTTAIAAIRAKRNFIGFELMPEYYDKANKRIEIERQQYKLF